MKKLLILFLLVPSLSWGGWWLVSEQSVGGGTECSIETDYVGYVSTPGASASLTFDRMYLGLYTPSESSGCTDGTFGVANVYHADETTDSVKVCIYIDDGDDLPDVDDTLVECEVATSSAIEWVESSAFSSSANISSKYWIGLITDSVGQWFGAYDSAGTTYYQSVSDYVTPPTTLTGTWSDITRSYGVNVEIGP